MPLTKRLVGVPVHALPTWLQVHARAVGRPPEARHRRMPSARLDEVTTESYAEAAKSEQKVLYEGHHRGYLAEVNRALLLRHARSVVSIRKPQGLEDGGGGGGKSNPQTVGPGSRGSRVKARRSEPANGPVLLGFLVDTHVIAAAGGATNEFSITLKFDLHSGKTMAGLVGTVPTRCRSLPAPLVRWEAP